MRAGTRKTRFELQQLTGAANALNEPVQNWVKVARFRGDVRFLNGLEAIKADAQTAIPKVSVRIRYRAGITTAMRLLEIGPSSVYEITAVLPDKQARKHVDLSCEVKS